MSLWHPVSALLLDGPEPVFVAPAMLRLLLRAGEPVGLRYAGDRMWPAVRHQDLVLAHAAASAAAGEAVVALVEGHPDLLRVLQADARKIRLAGDAEPGRGVWVDREDLLGAVAARPRRPGRLRRLLRRAAIDVVEALRRGPDGEPAESVRTKYEVQAPFYVGDDRIDDALLGRLRRAVGPRGRVIVAGSGAGRECLALAMAGYDVRGIDFSPAMVSAAAGQAQRRGLAIDFVQADLRCHDEPRGSVDAVLFTYDVYSFLPSAQERVAVLRTMGGWLRPGGAVLLSARLVPGAWAALVLTLQRAVSGRPWGASHTRWITPDGHLRRSFVQVFTRRALRRELRAGGFRVLGWSGGHVLLIREDP